MLIGILQTGDTPDELKAQYQGYADMFVRMFQQASDDFSFRIYRVCEQQLPATVQECDGWLITGSKFSAYDELPWIEPLKAFTREIYAAKLPLIGVCFGHQLIAAALGGRVEKSVKGWGLGLDTYTLKGASKPFDGPAQLHVFHQDQVVELPPNAEVYASSDFCQYAGLHIGDKVLTVQAHPEFPDSYNRDLLAVRRGGVLSDSEVDAATAQLQQAHGQIDSQQFGQWMAGFYQS